MTEDEERASEKEWRKKIDRRFLAESNEPNAGIKTKPSISAQHQKIIILISTTSS